MLFDTHAHYNDRRFNGDREELFASLAGAGVGLVLNPGCDRETSEIAVGYAETHPFIYAAAGYHPSDAKGVSEADFEATRALLRHPKVRAVGEIGLDYYRNVLPRDEQREVFCRQMTWARESGLPAIVHCRDAHGDCLEIVDEFPDVKGVFHCFSGSAEYAEELTRRGWYVSFTGSVTFANAAKLPEAARRIPADRYMIETDAPYLAPEPCRGKRNSSLYLVHIAERLAAIRGVSFETVARETTKNGKRLFGIE